ncbi:hypothetical protein GCM10010441_66050 [Kitasatospora paracochleata]|uniref:WD40 repeat protein n=1 Tax=Kitasatospora paracochleata TaxID=58354 RepID=A0ABT1J0X6_9ACTN|nr:hypothetical protein [Kitasatospora paracochleata]MCP2310741.1 hypothetical protein [Kitasatospora paracochleata]
MTDDASWVPPLRAGRKPAGQALLGWLEDPRAPRICRVGGSSGSGRTHLLAWLATGCPPHNPKRARRVHAYLPAAGLTVRSATWLLADRLRTTARTPVQLAAALKSAPPRVLVIADLDRAGGSALPDEPRRIVTELLAHLMHVPDVRLVVEAAEGSPAAVALGELDVEVAALDLDDPRWTEPDRFAAWCAKLPGTPLPAEQVYPSPGLARLAARVHDGAQPDGGLSLDPATPLRDRLRSTAAAWWKTLPDELRSTVRALAAVEHAVLAEEWATLPGAGDPDAVRRAGELLPPHADGISWRLHLEALAAEATAEAPLDHAELVRALAAGIPRTPDGRPDHSAADPERLGTLLRHALVAGTAAEFLADPGFVVHADPLAVTAALEHTPLTEGSLAEGWRLAGPGLLGTGAPAARAATLHAWLHGHDPATDRSLAVAMSPAPRWFGVWRHRPRNGVIHGLAAGRGPHRGRVLVATQDGVRLLDAYTGQDLGAHLGRLPVRPATLACAEDGALLALDNDGVLGMLPSPAPTPGPDGATAVAGWAAQQLGQGLTALATPMIDGNPLVVVGDADGRLTCFREPGKPGVATEEPVHRTVTALAVAEVDAGLMVVSGGTDGAMRLWKPGQPPLADPIGARPFTVTAVAAGRTDHGVLYLTAWADGFVRLLRLDSARSEIHLRLGSAVRFAAIDPSGRVHLALLDAVFCVYVPPLE